MGAVLALMMGCGGGAVTTEGGGGDAGSGNGGSAGNGGSGASSQGGSGGVGGGSAGAGGTAGAGGSGGSAGSGGSGGGSVSGSGLCWKDPPPGATLADPLPSYSGGTCPALVAGENILKSSGNDRKFVLVVPADVKPDETLPVLFLWHWLGGSAEDFIQKGEIQAAVDQQRFVAVVPRSKGDGQFQWPFNILDGDARMNEEYTFFDDMLSCVGNAYKVNKECVGSAGVSAGALFTDQLAAHRANRINAFLSLSGGTGGSYIRPWGKPQRKLPGLVLWGGPTDNCFNLLKFDEISVDLEKNLTSEGNFFLECIHNCGHSAPPLDPPADGSSVYSSLWNFIFDHPFWINDGDSPYKTDGLPANLPTWCGIGQGSSTPREGPCAGGGC